MLVVQILNLCIRQDAIVQVVVFKTVCKALVACAVVADRENVKLALEQNSGLIHAVDEQVFDAIMASKNQVVPVAIVGDGVNVVQRRDKAKAVVVCSNAVAEMDGQRNMACQTLIERPPCGRWRQVLEPHRHGPSGPKRSPLESNLSERRHFSQGKRRPRKRIGG